jgi:type I restriction enzyme, S subunit
MNNENIQTVPLAKTCNIVTGKLDSNCAVPNGKYPFYTCAPDPLKIDSYVFDDSVVLIAGNNAQGNFHINRYNGKFNAYQRTYVLTEKDGYDLDYLFYSLKLELNRLKRNSQGSQTKFLTKPILENIQIKDIDYREQEKRAEILTLLDSKIELNNKINVELEAMAKSIYDYWFVQFDFPDKNNKPYKSSGGKMVWSDELKREIPEGWEAENLKENSLSKLIKPGIGIFESEKIYLATSDVINNDINFKADRITFDNRESRANMQPVENSVWFAKMKNSKKILYFGDYSNYYLNNFILSTGFAGIKCDEMSLEYFWGFINNPNFEFIKDRLANGATQEAINNEAIALIPMVIPSSDILKKYHDLTHDIYKKIYLNQIENNLLAEIRDWLLPMLMNGQVSVN